VLGLERFTLGHDRGASHDSSRILRHSYHTPGYVRLTLEAYDDWARLERDAGTELVTAAGGLDLFPPEPAIGVEDYLDSLDEVGIGYELLDTVDVTRRWPQFRLPARTVGLFQPDAAIVPAARGTRMLQQRARAHGAVLRERSPVTAVRDLGNEVELATPAGPVRCRRLILCLDAWVNDVLADLGRRVPLTVTLEQVTYFRPADPAMFAPGRMPLWIWMDDPSFYGFPCYGEPTMKAAQDCGGPVVDPDDRGSRESPEMRDLLSGHMRRILPAAGEPVRSVRCQYSLTPDRDFVIGPVPGHEAVLVGLGAGHGFKFAPTFGRVLADLAAEGTCGIDLAPYGLDRSALTDPTYRAHWLV
jgi:sarcosine oxidase